MVIVRIGVMVMIVVVAVTMAVIVTMIMVVIMTMAMAMTVVMMMTGIVRRIACANAFDMMMVAFLNHAYFIFKAQHLLTILTVHAVHDIVARQALCHPIGKGIDHQGMIA